MDTKLKKITTIPKSYDSDLLSDWDLVPSCLALKLFQTNSHLKEAQTDLILKRIGMPRERMYHLHDWKDLQANKSELRRQFQTINKTICYNKASKNRFIQKTTELLNTQALDQDEIENIQLEIEKYSEIKEKMTKYVNIYSELFISYLERVAQKCPEFNSIQNILNEYEILYNCKNECSQLLNKEMEEGLELRTEMMKLVEEKSSRLKNLDNSLVMLRIRRRKAADVRKHWNNVVINLDEVIAGRLETSVTIQEGCYNLYHLMCKKRRLKPIIAKEDTKNQMDYIGQTILFYKEVLNLASALQQYHQQEKPVYKSSFVKSVLRDLVKKATSSTSRPSSINITQKHSKP